MFHLPVPWLAVSAPLALLLATAAPRPWLAARVGVGWGLLVGVTLAFAASLGLAAPMQRLVDPWTVTGVRADLAAGLVLTMVHLVGFAVVGFARTALRDDRGGERHVRALSATLAGVSTFVLADHLLVVVASWFWIGQSVHLLFAHTGRPAALRAAREKWLLGRLSELLLLGAVGVAAAVGAPLTFEGLAALPATVATPVALAVVAAVIVRTAVLPFHGWLVRVMEAPTPVSALLHAGVVNLGGLLLFRLAPLLESAPAARWVLVGVGVTTAVVGGLVSAARPSVKSALAWSTVAQMGFLLLECGLGAWSLALLHLLAHSCYKAHAFLSAGSAVDLAAARRFEAPPAPSTAARGLAGLLVALVGAGLAAAVGLPSLSLPWALIVLAAASSSNGAAPAAFLSLAWVGAALAFDELLGVPHPQPDLALLGFTLGAFAVGFGASLAVRPDGPLGRRALPALLEGLWLDRPFTALVRPSNPSRTNPELSP